MTFIWMQRRDDRHGDSREKLHGLRNAQLLTTCSSTPTMQHLLPLTLWTLIQSYLVSAQSPQSPRSLSLNSLTQFNSSSSLPNPAVFALPASNNLSVSIALCASTSSTPQFFVSNDTDGTDGTQVELTYGYGSWTGAQSGEGVLTVEGAGETPFEVGVSDNGEFRVSFFILSFAD